MPDSSQTRGATRHPAELIDSLMLAGRELSAATVLFHTTIAELRGLSVTDAKALDVLMREGPLTHAGLVERTRLAPASVSDMIDRLERRNLVRRSKHPSDGRRVLVTADFDRIDAEMAPLFASWVRDLEHLFDRYPRGELEAIRDFMSRAAVLQREAATELRRAPAS